MADFKNLRKNRYGDPRNTAEQRPNILAAPEVAPAAPPAVSSSPQGERRTRAKTGRTVLFSTRVSEQFDKDFRATAEHDNLLLTRLLELAFAAYKREKNR